jgi:large subunit ribosomal protein L29
MKTKEIKKNFRKNLGKNLKDLREELFNLRFQHAVNQLDNPTRLRFIKKDIARNLTEKNKKHNE